MTISDGIVRELVLLRVQVDDELLYSAYNHNLVGMSFRLILVHNEFGITPDDWKDFFKRKDKQL